MSVGPSPDAAFGIEEGVVSEVDDDELSLLMIEGTVGLLVKAVGPTCEVLFVMGNGAEDDGPLTL